MSRPDITTQTINFAAPRVGMTDWGQAYGALSIATSTTRIVNTLDIVPTLPPSIAGYQQVGQEFVVTFSLEKEILPNLIVRHAMGNYQTVLDHAVAASPQVWDSTFQDSTNSAWTDVSSTPTTTAKTALAEAMASLNQRERAGG